MILGFVSLNVEEISSDFFVEKAVKSYSDKTRAARVFRFLFQFQFQFLAKASESSPAAQNKLPVEQSRSSTPLRQYARQARCLKAVITCVHKHTAQSA